MNEWLSGTRLTVAAMCVGRARRAFDLCARATRRRESSSASRSENSRASSFKLADMVTEIDAADLLTLAAAWRRRPGAGGDARDFLGQALRERDAGARDRRGDPDHGGMGLMADLPLERFWRDARVERIWDGTTEIHRHIIAATSCGGSARDAQPRAPVPAEIDRRLRRPRRRSSRARRNAPRWVSREIWPVHPTKTRCTAGAASPRGRAARGAGRRLRRRQPRS